MVKKFSDSGLEYHEPPYTWEEEQAFYKAIGRGPVTVLKGQPPDRQPAPKSQPQPPEE